MLKLMCVQSINARQNRGQEFRRSKMSSFFNFKHAVTALFGHSRAAETSGEHKIDTSSPF